MPDATTAQRDRVLAEIFALAFVAVVASAAYKTGIILFLFPELAALSHDVMIRPRGRWARQPVRLILTPVLTAVAGILTSRHFSYGVGSILLVVAVSMAIIALLRSDIGPAFSAGVLPLALNEKSWVYPIAIFIGLVALVMLLRFRIALGFGMENHAPSADPTSIDDALEEAPHSRLGMLHMAAFVAFLASMSRYTGLRLILFPPLVVMSYEVFGHPEIPEWLRKLPHFPVVCVISAAVGIATVKLWGPTVLGVIVTVGLSMVMLRIARMHMPPVLAIGLLPYIVKGPRLWYPVAVGIGTCTLMVWFAMRARMSRLSFS